MKKADRVAALAKEHGPSSEPTLDPFYTSYFDCFNAQRYYEAHDVLEHLWLRGAGENYAYFKGLIQIAGAFVHLQKQFLRPDHPKDGRRLRPAARLFGLGLSNLERYRPFHMHFDVESFCQLADRLRSEITGSNFDRNPWHPAHPPQIALSGAR